MAYVIFKLHLIKGKCIIFVADIDRSYRLKLFFEQFGIRSCILNSELPVNSRIHVVEEFNRNVYDIIIASDEKSEMLNVDQEDEDKDAKDKATGDEDKNGDEKPTKKRRKVTKRDSEYGVSRGLYQFLPRVHDNKYLHGAQVSTSRMSQPLSTSTFLPQHPPIPIV